MNKTTWSLVTAIITFLIFVSNAGAHCQIPCGIYDDQLRANLIAEHTTTIEKSMQQIIDLGKASPVNYNQLVRWVSNKELEDGEKVRLNLALGQLKKASLPAPSPPSSSPDRLDGMEA